MRHGFIIAWLVVGAAAALPAGVGAQTCAADVPNVTGQWSILPYQAPINPISATLLHTGQVLIVAGSENDANNNSKGSESYRAAVWDPTGATQNSIAVQEITYDVFCSGTAALPDGRTLIVGGTSDYTFTGENRASIFNPATGRFVQSQNMVDGRWYATATALGDGRIMAFSGLSLSAGTNSTVEIYDLKNAGAGWTSPTGAPFVPPLYPRLFLRPDGRVFFTGQGSGGSLGNGWIFDPVTRTWTASVPTTGDRTYGSAVILPLLPPAYTPKVMNFGGGSPATATTEIIDLSASSPSWTPGPTMATGRIQMNAVILPDGTVLALDGSVNNEAPDTPGRTAELYDPVSNTFSYAGTTSYSRLYHSTALLLPDARVMSMGSNPGGRGGYEAAIEIYTPAYLFDANNQPITTNRPSITAVAPASGVIGYSSHFSVNYTSTSAISSAVLVRLGSVTHAFDMEQRLIGLCGPAPQPPCTGAGTLNLTAPSNSNIAPPGYYMLFLLDSAGVPSKAQFVQLSQFATPPPVGAITSPASDVTIPAGGSVSFSTTTTAAQYSWIFPGGSPATSVAKSPGNVTFSAPGTYVASLTVIDSNGNSDPNPPTRTITVTPPTPDFSILVTPSAKVVTPGQSTTFTVTVAPVSGFTGQVSLSVSSESGFPSGISSGGFSPASITGSGSSTLTMNTTTSAVPYALSLTITGTSGALTHTGSTTLLVTLAPPASLTATAGNAQVSLSWPASVGASGYRLKRATVSGGPYVTVACPTSTSYTDPALVNGTTYYYVVSAVYTGGPDAGGASIDSIEASATPQGPPPPPTGLAATAGNTQVALSWTASSGATSYNVKRATVSGGPYTTVGSPTTTSYTNTGLTNGTTYYYVVTAVNAAGESGNSSQVSATPQSLPAAPTGVTATPGNGQVALSWAASAGATSYNVKRATVSGGPYTTVGTPTTTSYTNTGLTNGTTYYYVVTAVNAAGESGNSSQVSATPQALPATPTGVTATPANAQVALSWTASAGATSYNVKRATVSGGPYTTVGTSTATSYTNTGLTNGTTYYYVVTAVNAAGESGNSSQVSATPQGQGPPAAPTGVTAAPGDGQVALSWAASTGATSYNVKRATVSGGPYTTVASPTTTSYTDTGLTNGTTYYYVVTAVNAGGESGNSAEVNALPQALVAAFSFNENTGSLASDSSGNGYTASLTGGVVWAAGVFGSALSFNGTTAYATVASFPSLPAWTVSAWVNSPAAPAGSAATGPVHRESNLQITWDHPNSTFRGAAVVNVAGVWYSASFGSLAGSTWYYLTGTYDGNTLSAYTNGVLINANPAPSGPASSDPNPLTFGKHAASPQFFNGIVDEVRIYSRALSPAEIQADMNTPIGTPSAPAAPTGVTATAGNAQVALTWTASAGATSYNVKRATVSGGPYTTVGTPTATSYTNTGLTNGTTYYYVVTAVNAAGESGNSSQVSATPQAPPAAPTGVTATAGNAQVALTWTASAGATSYNVKRATVSGGPYTTVGTPTATSYTNTGLTNGTTYYYVVTAVNAAGESGNSSQVSATPQGPPAAPTGVTATAGNAQVALTWTASAGATSYNVKRATVSGGPYTTVASPTTTSYTNTGLTNGTTYYYVVTAVNAAGESGNSSQVSATPQASPAAPTGVTATAGNAQVALGWAASAGATSYNVKRATVSGGPYTTVASPTTTSYTNTGLTNGITYYYVVTAVNAGGESGNSSQVSATPQAPPATPTGVTAAPGNAQVTLGWAASAGATSYNVKRATVSGGPYTTVASPTTTSYTNTGLTNGITYYYVVTAVNAAGESGNSSQVSATPQAPPATPTGVTATAGNAQVALSWAASAGATSYNVKRATVSGGPYTTVASPTTTSYTDTGLTNGTTYYYVVTAVNAAGESGNSAEVNALPQAPPATPTGVTATAGNAQVALSWAASAGATSYNVKRATVSGGPYTTVGTSTATSYTNTGLTNGTTYYYVVTAVNAAGESGNSAEVSATPQAVTPPPPAGLTATAGNAQVALSWAASAGATSYNVKRATVSGGPYTTVASPTTTSYTDTGLTNGTTYYYVVTAVNAAGESGNSAEVNALPQALVAAFSFNENTGSLASDSSGNGYTASLTGGVVWAAGVFGSALSFNGTTAYATVASFPSLPAWTVSAWVNSPAAPAGSAATGPVHRESNLQITWDHPNSTFRGAAVVNVAGVWYSANFGSLAGSTWYYLTGTYDGNTLSAYTNGVLINANPAPSGPASSDPNPLTFGKHAASPQFFNGIVDEVRIYSRALSPAEIQADMNTPIGTPSAPAAPTGLTATPGNAQVALGWTASAGATSYNVKRATVSGGPYITVASPTTTSYTDTGLTNGTTYYYVVTAVNAAGESGNSSQVSATPQAPPAAPTGVTATPGNAQVALGWAASAGATSYNVKRATVSGGPYTTVGTPTTTSYTNTGLTNGTTYYYVVTAVNAAGESGNSSEVSATPQSLPAAPTGVAAAPGNAQVALGWAASAGATSYNVKRATVSGGPYTTVASPTTTSYTDTGLTNGTTYYYVVTAVNAGGESGNSSQVSATPQSLPAAPTGVTAAPGNAQVALGWTASSGATSYNVKRATVSGGPYTTVASPTTTSYTDTGLTNGTTYYYVVTAVNAGGESGNSSQVSATPQAPPAAPTGVTAAPGNAQVALGWTASSGATSYNVKRATVSGGPYTTVASPTTTSYTDTGLTNGTTYYYVVTAVNAGGESGNSSQVSATPQGPPAAPTGVTAAPGNAQVALGWAASAGATSYNVKRATVSGGPYTTVASPTTTSYTDTGLTNGTTYYYVVTAVNAGGESGNSSQVSATPQAPPAAPTGVTAAPGNAQVALGWTASAGATSYNVKRATVSGGPYTTVGTTNATSYTDTGLTNGTTYYYVVTAVNAGGESGNSSQVSATPQALPAGPTGVTAAPGDGQVALSWTASSGATSYNVKRATVSGGPYTTVGTSNATSYTDTGLTNGTTYYYVVTAVNAGGESGNSSQVSATPQALPAAPTGVTAAPGDGQVALSWTASSGATNYNVKRATVSGGPYTTVASPTATSYTNSGLTNGTTYYYVVTAVNAAAESGNSSEVSATPQAVAPPPPAGLTATAGNAQVALSWAVSAGATSYNVKRATVSGGPYTTVASPTTTSYTDTGLTNGTTYYYVVTAVNAAGESGNSAEVNALPQALPPVSPTGLTVSATKPGNIDLHWIQSTTSGVTQNRIYRRTSTGSYSPTPTATINATTSYRSSGLSNSTRYCYVVTAVSSNGESAPSNEACATSK